MAPKDCPDYDYQAKPGEASLQYEYRYAVTIKPNLLIEQNNISMLDRVIYNQFDDQWSCVKDVKYELDSRGVLHAHFTYFSETKLRSYYPYFKKGWMIHMSFIDDDIAYEKWKNYLKKSDPNDQVLFEARCQMEYMFV